MAWMTSANYSGVQIEQYARFRARTTTGSTFGWPSTADIMWSAIPTTTGGKVELDVEVDPRPGDGTLTYYLRVTNIGAVATDYKVRRTTSTSASPPHRRARRRRRLRSGSRTSA